MCELFAVNAGRPVVVNDYLTEFFDHSHIHRDGWGISWRRDDAAAGGDPVFLHREPVPAYESDYIPRMLAHPVAARRLEAHIRFSTAGRLCEENCHPFRGEDISGRDWTLIHNGILFNEELLASYDLKEAGDTDSERAMLFLLDVLDEAALRSFGVLDFSTTFSALSGAIGQISNLNRLNLILDDGTYTYVHTNTSEDTLHFRQLADDAIVISTQPLGGEKERALWHPVPRNRLIAYRDGRIVRTSKPHGYVFCEAILELRKVYPEIMSSAEKVAEHA
jgi:glutamine amidotransferase